MGNAAPKTGSIHNLRSFRRPVSRAFALAAFGLLCLSAYLFKPASRPALLDEALYVLVAGSLTFWVAVFLNRSSRKRPASTIPEPLATADDTQPSSASNKPAPTFSPSPQVERAAEGVEGEVYSRPNLILILLGIAAMLVLIEINTGIFGVTALHTATSHVQFILFILGLIGITLGYACIHLPRFFNSRPESRSTEKPDGSPVSTSFAGNWQLVTGNFFSLITHHALLITIVLVAFGLRAVDLGGAVHHLVDEIHFSNAVISLFPPDNTVKLLWPINTITAFPWLFSYLQNWGVDLLGRNLEGLRAISVVMGTLGIPALYFLARELFDRRVALLAALLLAVFPPHIQFSRIGLNNIIDPLLGTLALAFLVRGLKHNRPFDFALGGAALGLTQYFYEGGRLLFPALIFLSLAWFTLVKPRFYADPRPSQSNSRSFSGNWQLATGN
ncbi:MAG: glycosyltransferase family 39 protein, partial [Anaerolineae bacterium]|nr:glycosyltransferase family 39 protein [Anaerolineae bacterium]